MGINIITCRNYECVNDSVAKGPTLFGGNNIFIAGQNGGH